MPTRTPHRPVRRPTRATFSDELRDPIERSELTPYALGKAAGVDPGILSRFLRNERGITSDTIDRIASTLGLHLGTATRAKGRPRREVAAVSVDDGEMDEEPASVGEEATISEENEDLPQ